MSCTYYLKDRKITKEHIEKLEELEKDFNTKLENLYNDLNKEIVYILPIQNIDTIPFGIVSNFLGLISQ